MSLTLELILLNLDWGASNPIKKNCKCFVDFPECRKDIV